MILFKVAFVKFACDKSDYANCTSVKLASSKFVYCPSNPFRSAPLIFTPRKSYPSKVLPGIAFKVVIKLAAAVEYFSSSAEYLTKSRKVLIVEFKPDYY